jgi:hypothetical protein
MSVLNLSSGRLEIPSEPVLRVSGTHVGIGPSATVYLFTGLRGEVHYVGTSRVIDSVGDTQISFDAGKLLSVGELSVEYDESGRRLVRFGDITVNPLSNGSYSIGDVEVSVSSETSLPESIGDVSVYINESGSVERVGEETFEFLDEPWGTPCVVGKDGLVCEGTVGEIDELGRITALRGKGSEFHVPPPSQREASQPWGLPRLSDPLLREARRLLGIDRLEQDVGLLAHTLDRVKAVLEEPTGSSLSEARQLLEAKFKAGQARLDQVQHQLEIRKGAFDILSRHGLAVDVGSLRTAALETCQRHNPEKQTANEAARTECFKVLKFLGALEPVVEKLRCNASRVQLMPEKMLAQVGEN